MRSWKVCPHRATCEYKIAQFKNADRGMWGSGQQEAGYVQEADQRVCVSFLVCLRMGRVSCAPFTIHISSFQFSWVIILLPRYECDSEDWDCVDSRWQCGRTRDSRTQGHGAHSTKAKEAPVNNTFAFPFSAKRGASVPDTGATARARNIVTSVGGAFRVRPFCAALRCSCYYVCPFSYVCLCVIRLFQLKCY